MKHRGKRLGSILLCAALIAALLPARASAAFEHMEVERNLPTSSVNHKEKIQNLKDGEVYTYTDVSLRDPAGNALPNTDFSVSLAAVGQKYPTTTTTIRPTVTVLVLDTSNSMKENVSGSSQTRMKALQNSAESFLDAVVNANNSGTNYVAVVTYATRSYKELNFTNNKDTLATKVNQMTYRTGDDGGTNTHGGLIAAYKMISNPTQYGLSQEQVKNAVYSVVFMSDGAPTFYSALQRNSNITFNSSNYDKEAAAIENTSEDYATLSFSSGGNGVLTRGTYRSGKDAGYALYVGGPGTKTDSSTVDNAKAAAAILKQSNTAPNVYSIYLKNSDYDKAQETMDAIASSKKEFFTPEKTTELTETFQNIAVSIKSQATPPIAEVEKDGALSPVSYVDMSYNLGSGFTLVGNTMQVGLGDNFYTFNRQTNGSYKGTDLSLEKLEIAVNGSVVNFRVPASLLPCNEPTPKTGAKVVAEPIKLFFTLRIDADKAHEAGVYPTASASTAKFYPTAENPFYYGENGYQIGNKTLVAQNTTKNVTDYYRASYSNPMPSPAAVTSFQTGDSYPAQTYADLDKAEVTGVNGTTLKVQYASPDNQIGVRDITFADRTEKTATLSLTTPDKNDVSQFTGVAFNDGDGNTAYDSLRLENGGIRVVYQGGKRSVFFASPDYKKEEITQTANGKFTCTSNGTVTLNKFTIGGVNSLSGAKLTVSEKSHSSGRNWWWTYGITVKYNGVVWDFGDIYFSKNSDTANKSTTSIIGTVYNLNGVKQNYYVTEVVDTRTVPVVKYQFNLSGDRLQVQTRADENTAWSTIGDHTGDSSTSIAPNKQGGYTVTSVTGQTVTTTVYTVENDALYKQVSTNRLSGVDATGWVTQSHSDFGSITLTVKLTAGDIITSAALTSLSGTNMAVANSSGSADLLLTLTISGNVSGISGLNLSSALLSTVQAPGSFTYTIKGLKGGGALPTVLVPGTYYIVLSTKSVYSDAKQKPNSATVSLKEIGFTINDGATPFTLVGSGQNVKLVLVTTTGH